MTSLLPFIVVGVAEGSAYALAGVGLVLTFRTSGIFNFSYGALATLSAYLFYTLHVEHGVPWPVAAAVCVAILGPALGFTFEGFGRGLLRVGMAWRVAATVGILVSIQAACTIIFGSTTRTFPDFLPISTFRLSGVNVTYEQLIVTVVCVCAAGALYVFLRTTRTGMAMRAVVDDPDLLALAGRSPRRVRRSAWVIGCMFATLSGLLLAPSVGLDPTTLTLLVVQAFGAAAVGRFTSLPLTWLGGLGIGIGESLLSRYGSSGTVVSGLAPSLPFLVLFALLLVSRRRQLIVREDAISARARAWQSPGAVQAVLAVVVLAFLGCVPLFVGYRVTVWTLMLADAIIFMSLGLLVRLAGQVSLCQIGFAAIGAAAFSKLAVGVGVPWLLAILLAGAVAVPVGALIAIPAMRFSGLYLALATMGFGYLLQDMFYNSSIMFGFASAGLRMPTPQLSWLQVGSSTGFYYVVLLFAVGSAAVTITATRSRLGRLLRCMAESPAALTSSGVNTRRTVVIVFCLSAFLAGVGGALSGVVLTVAAGVNFDPFTSLEYLAIVLIVVGGEPWFALIAAASVNLIPLYFTSSNTSNYLGLLFGVSVVAVALLGQPQIGIVQRLQSLLEAADQGVRNIAKVRGPLHPQSRSVGLATTDVGRRGSSDDGSHVRVRENLLIVEGLSVRFGGLVAVDDVSLRVGLGNITGLIGPNGAGKTTVLNACSGLVAPSSGKLSLLGQNLSRTTSDQRARMGLGRTFQLMQLCEGLSVWENVALGCEGLQAGGNVLRQVSGRRGEGAVLRDRVSSALDDCGLATLAQVQVNLLPSGQRRLVEIARCLAGTYDMLLLDEPSSGLDGAETERVGRLLQRVVADRGLGVLLIEHDMTLVMTICKDIYVMDFGKILFHGSPDETRRDPRVQAAYLGTTSLRAQGDGPERPEGRRSNATT